MQDRDLPASNKKRGLEIPNAMRERVVRDCTGRTQKVVKIDSLGELTGGTV